MAGRWMRLARLAAGVLIVSTAVSTSSVGRAGAQATTTGPGSPDTTARVPAAARYRLGVDYSHVHFDTLLSPWDLVTTSLSRKTTPLALIGSVNYAHRFRRSGWQFEGEAYPHLSSKAYAYLDAAWSQSASFPRWRGGAELYGNLPAAWELSAGWRQLHFTDTEVRIFTGSVGKYAGNYYATLRPYVSRSEGKTSRSAYLTVRRYGATADDFAGVQVGYGSTPTTVSTLAEVLRGNTFHASAEVQRTVGPGVGIKWGAEFEHENLPAGGTRNRTGFTLGLRRDL